MTRKTAPALTAQHDAQEPSQYNKINSSNSAKRKYVKTKNIAVDPVPIKRARKAKVVVIINLILPTWISVRS